MAHFQLREHEYKTNNITIFRPYEISNLMDEESDEKPCGYYYHSSFPLSENLKVFPPYNLISLLPVKHRGATE